jgi:hypothetical protein
MKKYFVVQEEQIRLFSKEGAVLRFSDGGHDYYRGPNTWFGS